MYYDRKIRYLDYFERGERIKGAGFAKMEARDRTLGMDINVTGLHETDTFEREILLCTEGREEGIGKIQITGGKGQQHWQWQNLDNIGGLGISYGQLTGVSIHLGAGREISCRWQSDYRADSKVKTPAGKSGTGTEKERRVTKTALPGEELQAAEMRAAPMGNERDQAAEKAGSRQGKDGTGHNLIRETREEEDAQRKREKETREEENAQRKRGREIREEEEMQRNRGGAGREAEGEETSSKQAARTGQVPNRRESGREGAGRGVREAGTEKPMEEKWRQLWAIYPHICPFQDEREYISIRPADFVIFPEESYKMVNNSFLLHGYYNYHHLLLTRVERRGEPCYYIGVPGNFFEKEKQVAIMFGFESFECAEEPAQAGDFGYYMMRTQL